MQELKAQDHGLRVPNCYEECDSCDLVSDLLSILGSFGFAMAISSLLILGQEEGVAHQVEVEEVEEHQVEVEEHQVEVEEVEEHQVELAEVKAHQ